MLFFSLGGLEIWFEQSELCHEAEGTSGSVPGQLIRSLSSVCPG